MSKTKDNIRDIGGFLWNNAILAASMPLMMVDIVKTVATGKDKGFAVTEAALNGLLVEDSREKKIREYREKVELDNKIKEEKKAKENAPKYNKHGLIVDGKSTVKNMNTEGLTQPQINVLIKYAEDQMEDWGFVDSGTMRTMKLSRDLNELKRRFINN